MAECINTFVDNAFLDSNNSLTHLLDTENNEEFRSINMSSYVTADDLITSTASMNT